jgi:diguanylate cyclase (GGDEF)-like protein
VIIATTVIPALLVAVALLTVVSIANLLRQRSRTQQLVIGLQTEQEQLAQANDRLAHVASHDSLTELLNRHGIIEHLERAIIHSRDSHKIAVLFMDVDRFKSINDSLGHGAGDQLLQVMGRRIRSVMPAGCVSGRLGGDEFIIVIDDATDIAHVSAVAHRLTQVMSEPLELSGRLVRISVN